MTNYLLLMRRALLWLFACCLGTLWLSAEPTLVVETTLTGATKQAVDTDGNYHSLGGGTATYSISINGETSSIASVESATYVIKKDGTEVASGEIGNTVNGGKVTFTAVTFTNFSENGAYEMSCTVTYKAPTAKTLNGIADKTITVWPSPQITGKNPTNDIVTCHGLSEQMSITTQGGYNNGWTYEWYLNNNLIDGATSRTYKPTFNNTGTSKRTDTYKVIAHNKCNDVEWLTDNTREFKVDVYPEYKTSPTAEWNSENITNTGCYEGDQITLKANTTESTYPSGQWTWAWTGPTSITNNTSKTATTTVRGTVPNNPTIEPYNVTVTYKYNGTTWFSKQFTVNLNVYQLGELTSFYTDSTNYLANSPIVFKLDCPGGYNNGWTFTLEETTGTGYSQDFSSKNISINATNNSNTKVQRRYKLTAVNRIGSNVRNWGDRTSDLITIWPSIEFPSDIDIDKAYIEQYLKVREGDSFTLSVDNARGGYQPSNNYYNNFVYTWQNGSSGTSYWENNDLSSGSSKSTRNLSYTVTIEQPGPYGNNWGRKVLNKTVTVYNRPKTPLTVVRKGNGTTQTLILTNGTNDDNNGNNSMITNLEYTYRFGYTDASGNNYLSEPLTRRWFRLNPDYFTGTSSPDFNTADARLWAIAEWKYNDGVTVTSGRKYVYPANYVEENFNASSFFYGGNSTNGAPSFLPFLEAEVEGINNLTVGGDAINMVGDNLVVNFDVPTDATINVYNVSGMLMHTTSVYQQTTINEPLKMQSLTRGMYLIEVVTSNSREIKKVVIR